MKHLDKLMVFSLFMLFSYGVDTFAYTYSLANMTGKEVKVRLYYVFGELTNKNELIRSHDTRRFRFGGLKIGLCLTKVMISIKKSGKWEKAREAEMGIIKEEDRFEDLKKSGLIGKAEAGGIKLLGLSMCKSRHFILIIDEVSKKPYAITSMDI